MANLVLLSSLIGIPVASLKENQKIGNVKDVLIDLETGKIIGLTVGQNWWDLISLLNQPKYIPFDDIIDFDKHALIVNSDEVVVKISEVVKAKKIYDQGFQLIGLSVVTQSKKRLGRVVDIAISMTHAVVVSIYVRTFLSEKIIPQNKIVRIERKKIIVEDEVLIEPVTIPKLA